MQTSPLKSLQMNLERRQDVRLNQIRFVCNDGDKSGIHVKSNLDETHRLDAHTDEAISWTDNDLVIIQNKLERRVEILLEAIRLPEGRQAILKPSRQGTLKLVDKTISRVKSEANLVLGPGESCTLTSSCWTPGTGNGRAFPV